MKNLWLFGIFAVISSAHAVDVTEVYKFVSYSGSNGVYSVLASSGTRHTLNCFVSPQYLEISNRRPIKTKKIALTTSECMAISLAIQTADRDSPVDIEVAGTALKAVKQTNP